MFDMNAGYIVMISGAVTIMLRILPFIAFGKKRPDFVMYLGRVLPSAVMAMLVVYCLNGINLFESSHGLPEFIACIVVIMLHIWKKNTLLSILTGTILYMFMIQVLFV